MTLSEIFRADFETARAHSDIDRPGDTRDPFERDYARIVHSGAFRTLQGKAQIHSPNWSGHLRTRVTHSLEVAQIGRVIAHNVGVPANLVEACCLAHDLGHPPFGHAGEEVLHELLQGYGLRFEGNAQTFRILTLLESGRAGISGLNLCRATITGVIKYPFTAESGHRKSLYAEDADSLVWLFKDARWGLESDAAEADPPRSIVAQIMDWADDIAYSIHDIEDALSTGFMKRTDLENSDLHSRVRDYLDLKQPQLGIPVEEVATVLTKLAARLKNRLLFVPRGQTKQVLGMYVNEFVTKSRLKATRPNPRTPADFYLSVPASSRNRCEILKALTMTLVVDDARTVVNRYQAKTVIKDIFEMYLENCLPSDRRFTSRGKLLPEGKRPILMSLAGDVKRTARFVADHLASLTDAQMQRLHSRVFGNVPASPYEPLIG